MKYLYRLFHLSGKKLRIESLARFCPKVYAASLKLSFT